MNVQKVLRELADRRAPHIISRLPCTALQLSSTAESPRFSDALGLEGLGVQRALARLWTVYTCENPPGVAREARKPEAKASRGLQTLASAQVCTREQV